MKCRNASDSLAGMGVASATSQRVRSIRREVSPFDRAAFKEVDWNDVVLPTDTEADLRALVRLMDPAYSERLKLPMPSGLLLIGPPGVGKTMVARLIATQTKRSFYPVTAADILGSATGASVKKLADLFARAKESSPSIIFIDEMDGLLPRNTGLQSQHDIQVVEQGPQPDRHGAGGGRSLRWRDPRSHGRSADVAGGRPQDGQRDPRSKLWDSRHRG